MFFFFFQAEDGIRDLTVTGVQTCALPIFRRDLPRGQDPVTDEASVMSRVALPEETQVERQLRPQRLDEYVGQRAAVESLLYPAMEDFTVNFVMDKGLNARTMRIPLRPFTLVGATTRPGMLSSPLRERFGIFHHLDFYLEDDLSSIIRRSASILGM